jgi:hypothetical protein
MMGAKGPDALAALGEGIKAGTDARRVSEATSRSDFDKNLGARHAVASDLIKQSYYNGTITAKEARTRQMALNAAMAASNAAAGRSAAYARAELSAGTAEIRQRATDLNRININNREATRALLRSLDDDIRNQTRVGMQTDPSALKELDILKKRREAIRASLLTP